MELVCLQSLSVCFNAMYEQFSNFVGPPHINTLVRLCGYQDIAVLITELLEVVNNIVSQTTEFQVQQKLKEKSCGLVLPNTALCAMWTQNSAFIRTVAFPRAAEEQSAAVRARPDGRDAEADHPPALRVRLDRRAAVLPRTAQRHQELQRPETQSLPEPSRNWKCHHILPQSDTSAGKSLNRYTATMVTGITSFPWAIQC